MNACQCKGDFLAPYADHFISKVRHYCVPNFTFIVFS